MEHTVARLTFRLLSPVILAQGLVVRATAPRFAPAEGRTEGSVGAGEIFHLLAIGDSIVAGVGVGRLENAMPGQLARVLSTKLGRRVDWMARGMSGIGTRAIRRSLVQALPRGGFHWIFVSAGVNDVTALRSTRHWRRELTGLVTDLRRSSPAARIVVSGLPPMQGFPLLPQPLRSILGMRARTFDRIAEVELRTMPSVVFIPNRFDPRPECFAPDGYHPSEASCRIWAENVVSMALRA